MRISIDFKDLLDSLIFIDIPRYWYSKNAGFHIVSWDQTAEIKVLNHVRLYLRLRNFSDNNRAPDLDFSVLLWAHEPQRFNGSLGGGVAQTKNNTQNLSNLEACCSQKVHIYIRLRIRGSGWDQFGKKPIFSPWHPLYIYLQSIYVSSFCLAGT